ITEGRQIEAAARLVVIEVADRNLRLAAQFARRLLGDDVNSASQRVAAIQSALRATQNFDALDIGDVEEAALRLAEVNAVHVHADGRFPAHRRVQRGRATNNNL